MRYKALAGVGSGLVIALAGFSHLFGIQHILFYSVSIFIVFVFGGDLFFSWLGRGTLRLTYHDTRCRPYSA